jgi:hypothetical protein
MKEWLVLSKNTMIFGVLFGEDIGVLEKATDLSLVIDKLYHIL